MAVLDYRPSLAPFVGICFTLLVTVTTLLVSVQRWERRKLKNIKTLFMIIGLAMGFLKRFQCHYQ